jgi:radical S-adenosyl methionine domain-containing protein 2
MVRYSKIVGYKSVFIITNGSKPQRAWFEKYGQYLDILGVSCDSIHATTNIAIGRGTGREDDDQVFNILNGATLSTDYGIKYKMNTVMCSLNKNEYISPFINELPSLIRWKVFQVLPLIGENTGLGSLRNVTSLIISNVDFTEYVERNKIGLIQPSIMKAENNEAMQSSYLMIDEYGRFLDSTSGSKVPTKSILEIDVMAAMEELISTSGGGFDRDAFYDRGGYYPDQWSQNL